MIYTFLFFIVLGVGLGIGNGLLFSHLPYSINNSFFARDSKKHIVFVCFLNFFRFIFMGSLLIYIALNTNKINILLLLAAFLIGFWSILLKRKAPLQ